MMTPAKIKTSSCETDVLRNKPPHKDKPGWVVILFCLLAVACIGNCPAAADDRVSTSPGGARRPNVLLILSDDQGSIDLNCYGATDLHTPNLDRLAAQGIRFTQMYTAFPMCTPARGALLTGRCPQRNGAVTNGRALRDGEITVAEMLRTAGYKTALIGKWHLGHSPGPNSEGFDEFFGHREGCIENFNHDYYDWDKGTKRDHDLWRNTTPVEENGTHFGELVVRETNRILERHKSDPAPFFIYAAFNSPHYPVQPLPKHVERYRDLKEPRRSYAAFVSTLDEQVGRIIGKLDELGLRENTLVVFMSDHGHSVEKRNNLWLKDPDPVKVGGGSAGSLRGHKFTLWEGGIRVPCIVSMPGTVPEGETRGHTVSFLDWFPTIAGYCNAVLPDRRLDGIDLRDVISTSAAPAPKRALHWMLENGDWAVRNADWKLVRRGDKPFLSNIRKDATEKENLSPREPARVAELTQLHEEWNKSLEAANPAAAFDVAAGPKNRPFEYAA